MADDLGYGDAGCYGCTDISNQACITMDFSWSIVRAAGTKPPANRPFDGIDILQALETNQPVQKRTLFWRARRGQRTRKAIRDGSLEYIRLQENDDVKEYLFDLKQDPSEKNNLVTERKEDVQPLKILLKNWEEKVKHKRYCSFTDILTDCSFI